MNNQPEENETLQEGYTFKPQGHHEYRQHGPYLVCKSCEIQHAIWIGIDKILVGFDEKGEAIVRKKKDVMGA